MKKRKNVLLKDRLNWDHELTELNHLLGKDNRKELKALHKHPFKHKDWYDIYVREFLELLQVQAKYTVR